MDPSQCPDCIGDGRLSAEERMIKSRRPAIRNDHFDDQHLSYPSQKEFAAWEHSMGKQQCVPGRSCQADVCEPARALGTTWEIGHITPGAYALDCWRIFYRDRLLGRIGRERGATETAGHDCYEMQPEWMRMLPADKKLRGYLRWRWMRECWDWDAETGNRVVLEEPLRRAVDEGRVAYDAAGRPHIVEGPLLLSLCRTRQGPGHRERDGGGPVGRDGDPKGRRRFGGWDEA
ncbi:hypothetical protein GGTG_13521 [Gaeumannomyces tritici R3-111a-1]|uniref:Uncharacterized protein n=1 Tax=Gaeumannomyces tritici (strain R3-111a-1) TaxID=644352 RepID=J3PJ40_GAET3|nr:hypothetical protein GGTG_13521 [Gaeumannomyces tritici R3-111a-1]EJT68932.1 hypothetical protein GGTG_13521 [Gaeumannomyces tritici R3-111a-1]